MVQLSAPETAAELKVNNKTFTYYSLPKLEEAGLGKISKLPYSIRILLENLLRQFNGGKLATISDIKQLANWDPKNPSAKEIPFMPSRVLLQDFTGVPCVADLAAMRTAVKKLGKDGSKINPLIPVDLVIDHSVQVDFFGSAGSLKKNVELEYERNRERYIFLRWAQNAFSQFRVVPPGTGIVHQVNLECLASVVQSRKITNPVSGNEEFVVFPDSLVGADSHTTMINGLGVFGWGVGGIEAEACMLGQPIFLLVPQVAGFKLLDKLPKGVTATDLVLTITQILRKKGVVGKFVEFFGPGLSSLTLPDRATIANMAPEYGATMGFFPVDNETLAYLNNTNRGNEEVALVETYAKAQGLFRTDSTPDPIYSELIELDMGDIEPSLAGPKRPQDRIALKDIKNSFQTSIQNVAKTPPDSGFTYPTSLSHGSVVIAAITSCTNTSNPGVMIAAGLLAKKAVELGLTVNPAVKTSLAPGSKIVTDYLSASGLMQYLEALQFNLVGYGCTTCIGNSGPLPEEVASAIKAESLSVAAVLSGNRNFEGRVHPLVKLNYLASPPLVVAYALAGTINLDLTTEPLGATSRGKPVYLKDIWPSQEEINNVIKQTLSADMFKTHYFNLFQGDALWNNLPAPKGELYSWESASTYILEPPFLQEFTDIAPPITDILSARVLAMLGDSVTTDHISPAGSIPIDSPAGRYLEEHGVSPKDFNSFGARRGNHEVMMRGTFGNIRLKNSLVPGTEGSSTIYFPSKESMSIYDAAIKYKENKTPLIILAGKEYGSGSSRDWAAKGTMLLGIKAVLAESYERIHRSNLVGMGVLPLQYKSGETAQILGLTGTETYSIKGIEKELTPGKLLTIQACREDGSILKFQVVARLDSAIEVDYYNNGGILPAVLRQLLNDPNS